MLNGVATGDLPVPQTLESLAQPHIDSFDYFLGTGMEHVIENIEPIEVRISF